MNLSRILLLPAAMLALLSVSAVMAGHEMEPGKMNLDAFVVLKDEVKRVAPTFGDSGNGDAREPRWDDRGDSEERAMARIRALAPVLAGTDQSQDRRIETIELIARQGGAGPVAREQAVEAIGQCVTNSGHAERVQRAALDALASIGYGSRRLGRVLEPVLASTSNPIPIRQQAIDTLRRTTGRETMREALRALAGVVSNTGHHEQVQSAAIDAIAFIGRDDVSAVEMLSQTLEDTRRPISVRLRTISAMLQLRDEQAREAGVRGLTQAVLNPQHHEKVQIAAVEAMAFIGRFSTMSLRAFKLVLRDTKNPIPVRMTILRVLDSTPGQNAVEALEAVAEVMQSSAHHADVQRRAAEVAVRLGRHEPGAAVRTLGYCLRDTSLDMRTRIAAIRGLAEIGRGNREAEEILERVTRDNRHHDDVRRAAQQALEELYRY